MVKVMPVKKLHITPAQEAQLSQSMYQVWNAIGADVIELDPEATAFDAAVMCVDADRILEFAKDVESNNLVKRAAAEGWLNALLKHMARVNPFL